MRRKTRQKIAVALTLVLLLSIPFCTQAETETAEAVDEWVATSEEQLVEENTDISIDPISQQDSGISVTSIANPTQCYLVVNTNSYAVPNPSTGHLQEAVAAYTNVWVVEKVWCSYNSKYYYYAGYTYNGASHRGYFCEDNVYRNNARLLPANVDAETKPANLKQFTSLAGTVYDGPATTYAQTGSVGQETIKLIRTEGNFNFIEYTVTSTGKLKRGYLDYTKITGNWATLSRQASSGLNGKTFYLKNASTNQYLDVKSWSTDNNQRMHQWEFHGDTNQIFKVTYDSTNQWYTIQPASCYGVNRWLTIQSISTQEHADRRLMIYDHRPAKTYQKFWIVKNENNPGTYKIVPVSSYGTMTVSDRTTSEDTWVNQYYSTTNNTNGRDVWAFESTRQSAGVTEYPIPAKYGNRGYCWLSCAKMLASAESSNLYGADFYSVEGMVKGASSNYVGGHIVDICKAVYVYLYQTTTAHTFSGAENKITSEATLRKMIKDGHAIEISLYSAFDEGIYSHAVVINSFLWNDEEHKYEFEIYDPYYVDIITKSWHSYIDIVGHAGPNGINLLHNAYTYWKEFAGYKTSYLLEDLLDPDTMY